jgi:hypothetical protein
VAEGIARGDTADELVRDLILRRFAEQYERLPYSTGFHILHCDRMDVADVSIQEGGTCLGGTCDYTDFAAIVSCQHAEQHFELGESGRLPRVLSDLAELAEEQRAARSFPGDRK